MMLLNLLFCLVCHRALAASPEFACATRLLSTTTAIRDGLWELEVGRIAGELRVAHRFGSLIFKRSSGGRGEPIDVYLEVSSAAAVAENLIDVVQADINRWDLGVSLKETVPLVEGRSRYVLTPDFDFNGVNLELAQTAFLRLRAILLARLPDSSLEVSLHLENLDSSRQVFRPARL